MDIFSLLRVGQNVAVAHREHTTTVVIVKPAFWLAIVSSCK